MRVNTSLKLLVITGALLSAEAALAQNLFSPVQVLVATNTLKAQPSGVNSLTSAMDSTISVKQGEPHVEQKNLGTSVVAVSAAPYVTKNPQQFGSDEDWSPTIAQPLSNRQLVSARTAQGQSISDVANLSQNSQLVSGVPLAVASSEASVEIFVPAPRTRTIKVPTVSRLPRAVKRTIPSVVAIPIVQSGRTISPTPNATNFNQIVASEPINVPQPINNVPTVPSLPNGSQAELIYPLMNPAPTTSRFGWRTHPLTGKRRFHSGIDIGAPSGTPVVATASGTVISAGWNGGYGKAIIIQHNDVQQTLYGHLSEISVQPGQQIAQGVVIGLVGSTGNSTGPHLHFESRSPGGNGWVAVDPTQEVQYAIDNLRRSMPYAGTDNPQGL